MQIPKISGAQIHQWASPLVYLSNNGLSFAGVLLVTTAVVSWLFLLPLTFGTEPQNPYLGILA